MATAAPQVFEVSPPSPWAWVGMGLLGGVLPLGVVAMLMLRGHAAHAPVGVLVAVFVLALVVSVSLRRRSITLSNGMLEIRAGLYRHSLAVAQLDLERARIVDLDERTELRPFLKTGGMAMPGFKAGHFRLRGGLDKAFCLLTRTDRVLWLPQRDGKSQLLLSLERPQALLDALHSAAA